MQVQAGMAHWRHVSRHIEPRDRQKAIEKEQAIKTHLSNHVGTSPIMADKKKGPNDSPASTKPPKVAAKTAPKAAMFCKTLGEFFKTAKALEKDTEGMEEYTKLIEAHVALKKELEVLRAEHGKETSKLRAEIKDLTIKNGVLVDAFQERCVDFDKQLQEAQSFEEQTRRLQESLDESNQKNDVLSDRYRKLYEKCNTQAAHLRDSAVSRANLEALQAQVCHLKMLAADDQLVSMDPKLLCVVVLPLMRISTDKCEGRITWKNLRQALMSLS